MYGKYPLLGFKRMSYALKSRRGTYQVTGKTWHLGSASLFYFCQSPASDLNVVTMEREVQGDCDVRNLRELICDLRFHFPKAALPTRSPSPLDKLELFIADPARTSEAWEVLSTEGSQIDPGHQDVRRGCWRGPQHSCWTSSRAAGLFLPLHLTGPFQHPQGSLWSPITTQPSAAGLVIHSLWKKKIPTASSLNNNRKRIFAFIPPG